MYTMLHYTSLTKKLKFMEIYIMVKLELMDWKKLESDAREALRQSMMVTICHQVTLKEAEKQIKKFEVSK